jgi:Zn-dependent protease with chaperone function
MATDFFDRQDEAHKKTGRLIALFVLAVALIILSIYAAFTAIIVAATKHHGVQVNQVVDIGRFVGVSAIVLIVILSGSLYKIAALREGGSAVARLLGGEPLDPGTVDLAERRLLNVVEEMALASGVPVPTVYILSAEHSINAFAAGFDPSNAVIAVSRGCLDYLTRDELQGVIGHEFSHILNGDMRLNVRLIGVLHGILLIGLIGYTIIRYGGSSSSSSRRSSDDKKDSGTQIFLLGLALLIIGYVGVFFGRLIKAAISRQREFLADASSIQFTRNPEGIGGALKKIGGLAEGSRIENANAEQACHMFFGQGVSAWLEALATHPPLVTRIRRIDPNFDGRFPEVVPLDAAQADAPTRGVAHVGRGPEFLRRAVSTAVLGGMAEGPSSAEPFIALNSQAAVASVGAPTEEHVAYADDLLASLPAPVLAAARDPFAARALVYALLLDSANNVRQAQLAHLDQHDAEGTLAEVLKLEPIIGELGAHAQIPIVDLALPALRRLSPPQYSTFRANIDTLTAADQQLSLFEFVLRRMLLRHLDRHFGNRTPAKVRYSSIGQVANDAALVLSVLAYVGQESDADAGRAFEAGARRLGNAGSALSLLDKGACSLAALDRVLDRLADGSPTVKRGVLDASTACIAADGRVSLEEGELLRAIADALDCPMPPLVGAAVPNEVAT